MFDKIDVVVTQIICSVRVQGFYKSLLILGAEVALFDRIEDLFGHLEFHLVLFEKKILFEIVVVGGDLILSFSFEVQIEKESRYSDQQR